MARIAVGGFQHETNTFAPAKADFEAFASPGSWPALTRGGSLFAEVAGINIPIAGFVDEARSLGHQLVPLTWAAATPSAQVTDHAFERILGQILGDLGAAGGLDGVYLDLHGAMVTESHLDGEAEILRRVRALVGPALPLVASLDLHANVSPEMVALADALVIYRSYPHVDMAETGAAAARQLDRLIAGQGARHKAFRQLPFLIPTPGGCTLVDPAKELYETLAALESEAVPSLSFACGFSTADTVHAGPSVLAYGTSREAGEEAVGRLADLALKQEAGFWPPAFPAEEAVARAIACARTEARPIVLADTQDNPGGGGPSDTVGLLEALIRHDAEGAALALMWDPAAARTAHAAGIGTEINIGLGAKSGLPGQLPVEASYRVEALGDGRFTGTGPFYRGARMDLGPMARLRLRGVEVLVASRKVQAADRAIFRHLGVEPAERRILALKSSVHFRADFQPIAAEILVVTAPGPNLFDHRALSYRHLRPGVRLMPGCAATS